MRWLWVALALFVAGPGAAGQEAEGSQVERWIELAREGRPQVRPQAAQRLVDSGAEGAAALKRAIGADETDLAGLGADLVEVLARFEDPELRAIAWRAVDDPDFPWRSAAVRSLAHDPASDELQRFVELLQDPLPAVRVAAIDAFPDSSAGMVANLFHARLADEDGRVRRAAAFELARRGLSWAKLWLVEELLRGDRWFEIDTGRFARFEAARMLRQLGEDLGEYDPSAGPESAANRELVKALRTRIEYAQEREPPSLPPAARAEDVAPPGRIGLELRSCRKGELFLQWGPGDLLFVGQGRPREIELESGTLARLETLAAGAYAALDGQRTFGRPGCDLEALRLDGPDRELDAIYLQKGPEPRPELRPAPLDTFVAALVDSLPPAEADLRQRLSETLEAVAGPFRSSDG